VTARFLSALYATGLALTAFSAIYWPAALGPLAASPGILLIAACLLMRPFVKTARQSAGHGLQLLAILGWSIAGSALSLAIFGWSALYASKFVTLGLLTVVWLSPLLMHDVLLLRHLQRAALTSIAFCLAGYLLSDLFPQALPQVLRGLLFSGEYAFYQDGRPRGFTEEPGHFSTLLGRMLFIAYLVWEAKRTYSPLRLVAMLCATAVTLVILGSKGAVVGIVFAIAIISIRRRQLPYLVLLAPLVFWAAMAQFGSIVIDIEQFTSTSTRLTLAFAGAAATMLNPLGWGSYGFYPALQKFGGFAIEALSDYPIIFFEVQEIVENLVNVSTKSTLLDFSMILGWPFLLLLYRVLRRIDLGDPRAQAGLAYLLLTSLSTSANQSIAFFVGLVVVMKAFPARGHLPRRIRRLRLPSARTPAIA